MLANDEALAVTLGLLFARRYGLTSAAPATEGALAKIERVLPETLRAPVRALGDALVLDLPMRVLPDAPAAPIPAPATLLALATAAAEARRVALTYRAWGGDETMRPFDPYGVARLTNGAWYAVGYCHLRDGVRVFRLDRVTSVAPEGVSFTAPADFDCLAYVRRSLATLPVRWSADIVLHATLAEARQWVSPLFAVLTEEGGEVVLRCTATDIDWLARTLVGLPFDFRVRAPEGLRAALARLRVRVDRLIAASSPENETSPYNGAAAAERPVSV